jgi:hypothetical protein
MFGGRFDKEPKSKRKTIIMKKCLQLLPYFIIAAIVLAECEQRIIIHNHTVWQFSLLFKNTTDVVFKPNLSGSTFHPNKHIETKLYFANNKPVVGKIRFYNSTNFQGEVATGEVKNCKFNLDYYVRGMNIKKNYADATWTVHLG